MEDEMQLYGRVLWWDANDQNGIIKDTEGRKIYFDLSTVDSRTTTKLKSGLVVRFEINPKINNALCAHKVSAANHKEKSRHDREALARRQLSLF
jgi:cold shock CspA family protein